MIEERERERVSEIRGSQGDDLRGKNETSLWLAGGPQYRAAFRHRTKAGLLTVNS